MEAVNTLRLRIIRWNNRYPLDREYRKKYNIGFGSPQHREVNQVDIYLDWLEDQLNKEYLELAKDEIRKEKEYEKGTWLSDAPVSNEKEDDLFDQIKF